MLIPFGILSAASVGPVGPVFGPAYDLIETEILAGTASSVVFSSLATYASSYKHLQIRLVARDDRSGAGDSFRIQLNADSGANYARHGLQSNGNQLASFGGGSVSNIIIDRIGSASEPANSFGSVVIDFLDIYSTTKNKTVRAFGGLGRGSTPAIAQLTSGVYLSTTSITSIDILARAGQNFVAGSRFSLYGLRG